MPPRHHVLLIGIDAYDGGGMLSGCVNDIDVVQRLLIDRVGVPDILGDPLDSGAHPLAGDRTADEHDLPVEARDHAAAGGGLLNGEGEDLSRCEHAWRYVGSGFSPTY